MATQMTCNADGRTLILFDSYISHEQVDELNACHAAMSNTRGRFVWVQDDGIGYITKGPLSDDLVQKILDSCHSVLGIGMLMFYHASGTGRIFSVYAPPQADPAGTTESALDADGM